MHSLILWLLSTVNNELLANLMSRRILRAIYRCTGLPFTPFHCCKGRHPPGGGLPPPTCMCVLMRSRGAEMVFDTAADRPPATQCRDQYSSSVRLRPAAFSSFNDVFSKHCCMPVHMACRTYFCNRWSKATGRCKHRYRTKKKHCCWRALRTFEPAHFRELRRHDASKHILSCKVDSPPPIIV